MRIAAIRKKPEQWPWHMLLLILFFLLHGYRENDGLVPMADLLLYGPDTIIIFFMIRSAT